MNEFIHSVSKRDEKVISSGDASSRKGSRKGSAINTLSHHERQQLYDMIDAKLRSEGKEWDYVYKLTGKDYEGPAYEEFSNMPENSDWVRGLILQISRERNGSRKGSRKGNSPTHDDIYDMINFIDDAYEVTEKYFDGYDKTLNDLDSDHLSSLARDLKNRFPEEYQEYVDNVYGSYKGGRKGSVDWDKFMGWESASNPQDRDKFVSAFEEITGHKYDSEYGDDFDNEDEARRILELLDR